MKECELESIDGAKEFIENHNKSLENLKYSLLKTSLKETNQSISSSGCWKITVDQLGNRISNNDQGNEEIELGCDNSKLLE